MEKIIYALWRPAGEDQDSFSRRLREETAPALLRLNIRGLQLNLSDSAVSHAAAGLRSPTQPPIEAVAHVWVDSAVHTLRHPVDEVIRQASPHMAGYLVTESQPLRNTQYPPELGERTFGFSQVVFMARPPRLAHEAWLDLWHGDQTRLAVALQNNFSYAQNVVVRPLTYAAPPYDAIVEECLFPEAMVDRSHAFRGTTAAERSENARIFVENTAKMVDFDKIDVLQTSQYVFKHPCI